MINRVEQRAGFVPDVIWLPDDGGYRRVVRSEEPDVWATAVAADAPVVTQVDDRSDSPARGTRASSSSSQPSLVHAMLDVAELGPGMRVLEIGTGTGWTAALLSERLGAHAVTTVEVDADVAAQARTALHAVGHRPTVIVGDGALGWAAGAPYDRVLAMCAVDRILAAWIEQTRPGGVVSTPWGTEYHNGAFARVAVHEDGTAEGRFVNLQVAFMRLRAQRGINCPWDADGPGEPAIEACPMTSSQVYEVISSPAACAIGLHLPGVHKLVDEDALTVRVHDQTSGSWARCVVTVGSPTQRVAQAGPRRLWDEVGAAHRWWTEHGRPGLDRFGLTATVDGQTTSLDHPLGARSCAR